MNLEELSYSLIVHANDNFDPSTIPGFKTVLKAFLSTAEKNGINEPCQELYDTFISVFGINYSRKTMAIWFCRVADLLAGTHALYDEETFFNKPPLPSEDTVNEIFKNTVFPVDNMELSILCVKSAMLLKKCKFSKSTIGQYWNVWNAIICRSYQTGTTLYNKSFLKNFVDMKKKAFDSGRIKLWKYKISKKAVHVLIQVATTGTYTWFYNSNRPSLIHQEFFQLQGEYLAFLKENGLRENTIKAHMHVFRRMFNSSGLTNMDELNQLSPATVKKVITYYSERYSPRSMSTVEPVIRQILDFLYDRHYVERKLSGMILHTCSIKDNVAAYLSDEDAQQLINGLDDCTKRDKAIILVAYCLGLRGSDICNLKFENIDWNDEKIHIVQVKTGRLLTVPLVTLAGNAIYEYITEERPVKASDVPYVFVAGKAPYRKLNRIYGICQKILKKNGIKTINYEAYGSHVFRYTLVHRLLNQSVPHQVITDSLGHKSTNADKPYISIDEDMLKKCALDLPHIDISGREVNNDDNTGDTISEQSSK